MRTHCDKFVLYNSREDESPSEIWQEPIPEKEALKAHEDVLRAALLQVDSRLTEQRTRCLLTVSNDLFFDKQRKAEKEMDGWAIYIDIFRKLHGRNPVLYDLYCGGGGFSRGARNQGVDCYGFDVKNACKRVYEREPVEDELGQLSSVDSGMRFKNIDVESNAFWDELEQRGCIGNFPPPDIIHASPPCNKQSKLHGFKGGQPTAQELAGVNRSITRLEHFEKCSDRPLVWQVENVPGSENFAPRELRRVKLCGSMFGHRVFRHRVFYGNYDARTDLEHDHSGMLVGSRGVRNTERDLSTLGEPNMYGIYSRREAGRGTYDEWHGALGALPNTYSRELINGVLPLGYGRYLSSQMVAASLQKQFGIPVAPPSFRSTEQQTVLERWAVTGEATSTIGLFLKRVVHRSTATHDAPEQGTVPREHVPQALELEQSVLQIGRPEQQEDPELLRIMRELGDPKSNASRSGLYVMREGVLCHRYINTVGQEAYAVYVPTGYRYELMHHFHFTLNPGHKKQALYPELANSFYWPNMAKECTEFTARCRTCTERDATMSNQVPAGYSPTPELPFDVIHLDCKLPNCKSGDYRHILVVICALTRYTIYIPMERIDGASVFRALFERVYSVFGIPRVAMVSDNGPEFRNGLMEEMAQYLGYRRINVMPWHPQANGIAEAAVKRIKLLLDRHTARHRNWHKVLPLAQYALNTSILPGNGISAFAALFGREHVRIPELENPVAAPAREPGSVFLESLRERLRTIHAHLRQTSDEKKQQRQRAAEVHRYVPGEQTIRCGDTVWLVYRNKEYARRLMKAGGQPWKFPYKVEAISHFGVKLIPTKGAPRVQDWQPIHRVTKSPPEFHDELPIYDTTSEGISLAPGYSKQANFTPAANPLGAMEIDGAPDDDGAYGIEDIISAKWSSKKKDYMIKIKWKGYKKPTEETREFMLDYDNCTDPEMRSAVRRVVREAKHGSKRGSAGDCSASDDSSDDDLPQGEIDENVDGGTDQMMLIQPETHSSDATNSGAELLAGYRNFLNTYRSMM